MMGVLWSPGANKDRAHDETLQYLIILCCKVALNTLVLFFWLPSIHKSLMGLCSIFMYLADVLLAIAISCVWFSRDHLPTSTSLCFILAHSSAVYALLPLLILIAGAFDYATYLHLDTDRRSQCRTISYCVTVLLMWGLPCIYSYHYTNTQPLEIYNDKNVKVLACPVQGSTVLFHFSTELSIAVVLILLLYFRKLLGWIKRANRLADHRKSIFISEKDQCFSYGHVGISGDLETDCIFQEISPPLFVSLTLGFALNWMPYLLMCVACDFVGFVVPAYASINLLWMACANSVLVGITFWYKSDRTGPFSKFPDDICMWSIYWYLSKGTLPTVDANWMVHKTTTPFHEIKI